MLSKWLVAGVRSVSLRCGASDVGVLLAAVKRNDWHKCATYYRGDLLDQMEFSELWDFEEWLLRKRRQLRSYAGTALEVLKVDGHHDAAAALSEALASSNVNAAVERLQAQPKPPPTPAVDTIHAAVEPAAAEVGSRRQTLPFVGRRDQLRKLEEHFQLCFTTGARLVLIGGEAGVGKTTLLNRYVRLRVLRGSLAVSSTSYEPERNVAFGIVSQWLQDVLPKYRLQVPTEPWLSVVKEAFPYLQVGPEVDVHRGSQQMPTGQQQLYESLRRFLEFVAGHGSFVIGIDDIKHADSASLAFVHYIIRSSAAPILFVATERTEWQSSEETLSGWPDIDRVDLPPLVSAEIDQALERMNLKAEGDSWSSAELLELTGGNPLLLSAILDSRPTRNKGGTGIPSSVVGLYQPRFSALSTQARLLLGALAVLGEPVGIDLATEVAGIGMATAALEELLRQGLVIDRGGRVAPRQSLIVEVTLETLRPAERRLLHGRAARALASNGRSSPALLAVQHDIAGNSVEAFTASLQAAAASEILFAHREREFFLKLALSHAPDSTSIARARIALGSLLIDQGRANEAQELLRPILFDQLGEDIRAAAEARRHIARLAGVVDAAQVEEAISAADALSDHASTALIAELYGRIASAAHSLGLAHQATSAANAALVNLDKLTGRIDGKQAYKAITVLGFYIGYQHALSELERLLPVIGDSAPRDATRLSAKASLLVSAGQLLEAERLFLEALELTERHGLYDQLFALRNNLGVCYLEQGRYHEAESEFDSALKEGITAPDEGAILLDNLSILEYERADYSRCIERSHKALASGTVRSGRGIFAHLSLIGLSSLALGKLAGAFETRRELTLKLDQYPYWSADMSYVEIFLARMAVLEGAVDDAVRRLRVAVDIYSRRDKLVCVRLEVEVLKLVLPDNSQIAAERATAMLNDLRGSGARPLIDRLDSLRYRSRR